MVFVLIDAIYYVDNINGIDPGVLNYSVLQLKDDTNDPTNSGMNFCVKKGEIFKIAGIY